MSVVPTMIHKEFFCYIIINIFKNGFINGFMKGYIVTSKWNK